ncbi:MAG TPA: hypothetical protein VG275_07185 [Solirubrobacteraceae bacterium]|jgi:hypothetical protein|nr:hypothetical protein [Solirubrobacteraceae bacterium]
MGAPTRDPTKDPTPLDRASFYVESLRYGAGPGKIEGVDFDQMVSQMEALLRDARVTNMSGSELIVASEYYVRSLARSFRCPPVLARSVWHDGLTHGIALAGGLEGELRKGWGAV